MYNYVAKLICLFALFFGYLSSHAQNFKPKLADELQYNLDSFVKMFSNTKGMSVAIHAPGNGIWKGASGLSSIGVPITAQMNLGIASNSKLFTAVVLLNLAENKILSLDDSLHTWLKSYKNVNPNITIRQLLNHSSGVADPIFVAPLFDSIQANLKHFYTPDEVLTYLGASSFTPGNGYGYSNVNYILAGMVAQSATGFHISKLIRDSILTPLNMVATFYDIEEAERGTIAHRWFNGIDFHDSSRISLNTAGGAAGSLFSTASEMVQWYDALLQGRIINKGSIKEMTTFTTLGNYGLGIMKQTLFGFETWGHGGRTLGYKSRIFYDPCLQITTCGLTNSDPSAVDGVTALLHKVVLDRLPSCPASIVGAIKVCKYSNETYIIHPITRATSYEWFLPNGSTVITTDNSLTTYFGLNAVDGKIKVRGVNEYGVGLTVEQQIEIIKIPNTVFVSNGNTITVDSAATAYQWLNCDSNYAEIANATSQSFQAKKTGNYAVAIYKDNCWDTSICVAIKLLGLTNINHQSISIKPNPFSVTTTLEYTGNKQLTSLWLVNSLGQTIKTIPVTETNKGTYKINRDGLSNGIYHLFLEFDDHTQAFEKLVVYD